MCPFVNKSDARCAAHLTLQNIASAFTDCAGQHIKCPVYQELTTDDCNQEDSRPNSLLAS